MQREELSSSCQGLLLSVFQQAESKNDGKGFAVGITSAHSGSGVSQITDSLAEVLRRDGTQSVISLCARQLYRTGAQHTIQDNLSAAIAVMRSGYRYVLIDCGSMSVSPDAIRLAPLLDGIVLVSEANRTQTDQIRHAEKTLESVNGKILGHVLNKRTYVVPNWFYRMLDAVGA